MIARERTLGVQACPNSVDFIVVRDKAIADTIDVKRLPKRPAPPRFGKKLSAAQRWGRRTCVDPRTAVSLSLTSTLQKE